LIEIIQKALKVLSRFLRFGGNNGSFSSFIHFRADKANSAIASMRRAMLSSVVNNLDMEFIPVVLRKAFF
jgi:hypothetical protein